MLFIHMEEIKVYKLDNTLLVYIPRYVRQWRRMKHVTISRISLYTGRLRVGFNKTLIP